MKKLLVYFAVIGVVGLWEVRGENEMLNAVVKLETTTSAANIIHPWENVDGRGSGTGAVIGNGRILTCAHCVTDSTFIRIRKHNEDSLYRAKVEFIDNDCDLALVKVEDPAFMSDITPMEIGETPEEQSEVLAVGYPLGGDGISFTRGIVSRIEDRKYAHSRTELLAVQVDAAINPGNSGGPVLDLQTGKIGGVAFQGNKKGEALGYMIPTEIIRHFLRDIEDGSVNGICDMTFFSIEELESESARRYLKMRPEQTGIAITDVAKGIETNSLSIGDVLLEIDGYKVANNGNIRIEGNKKRYFTYPMYMKQIGEQVPIKVLRDGAVVETSLPVRKRALRTFGWLYDTVPDYYIFGGIVFTRLSLNLLVNCKFHDEVFCEKKFADDEAVVISDVLADDVVEGYHGAGVVLVRTVNDVKVRNLRHLIEIIEASKEEFIKITVDAGEEWSYNIIVDTEKLRKATPRILETYRIPADRSKALLR